MSEEEVLEKKLSGVCPRNCPKELRDVRKDLSENVPVVVGIVFVDRKSLRFGVQMDVGFSQGKFIMVHLMLQDNVAVINSIATGITFGLRVRLVISRSRPGILPEDRGWEVLVRLISIPQVFFRLAVLNCSWHWYDDIRRQTC